MSTRQRVLVAGDHDRCRSFATWLGGHVEVVTATDAEVALDRCRSGIDIVLVDHRSTGSTATAVLEALAEADYEGQIVTLGASDPSRDVADCHVDVALTTPVSSDHLRRVVQTLAVRARYSERLGPGYDADSRSVEAMTVDSSVIAVPADPDDELTPDRPVLESLLLDDLDAASEPASSTTNHTSRSDAD